jgi:hypothetical protein
MRKIILFIIILITSCIKEEKFDFIEPEIFVSTAYLKNRTTTIEVNCETINPSSVNKEEFGICWSEKPNPTIKDNYQYSGNNSIEDGPFTEQILNVKANTKYYIRGYMRIAGRDVYSKDFIYDPEIALGWNRLEDISRESNTSNLPNAYLFNNSIPAFQRKIRGFEEAKNYLYNADGRFWSNQNETVEMLYNQCITVIEYGPGLFDYLFVGGYKIENQNTGIKKFTKKAYTNTFSNIDEFPGANDVLLAGFGAGNKGFIIEQKHKPDMYAFNEESFTWEKMKSPPFIDFTNIKATNIAGNGFVILENSAKNGIKNQVFHYDFKTDSWQQLEDFPGPERVGAVLFSVKNKVYYGLGENKITENGFKDFWAWDLTTQKWQQVSNYPGAGSSNVAYVKKENSVYIGLGYSSLLTEIGTSRKFIAYDFWEFRP